MSSASAEDGPGPGGPYQERQLAKIAARWDAKAEQWDRKLLDPSCHLNEDGAYARFLEVVEDEVRKRQEFCAVQGVIDVGCATGLVLARVIGCFAWGLGVDISSRMINMALAKEIPRATFVVGDCFGLAATSRQAGAILSRGILLSHYGREHAERLLQIARSCLVPSGFTLWDFLNLGGRGKFPHSPINKTYFEFNEIRALAMSAGFSQAEILGNPHGRVGILLAGRGG